VMPSLSSALRPVRLVLVKLGGTFDALDREAWSALATQLGWSAALDELPPSGVKAEVYSSPSFPTALSSTSFLHLADVCVLSCVPAAVDVPSATVSACSSPIPMLDSADGTVKLSQGSSSSGSNSGADAFALLQAALDRAQQSLAERVGLPDWWLARGGRRSLESEQPLPRVKQEPLLSQSCRSENGALAKDGSPAGLQWPSAEFIAAVAQAPTASTGRREQASPSELAAAATAALPLRVALHAVFRQPAPPVELATAAEARSSSKGLEVSAAGLDALLRGVLAQWTQLAAALPLLTQPQPAGLCGTDSCAPCAGLPLHVALLTRMQALMRTL